VPNETTVYLVSDDFGEFGRAWPDVDDETNDLGARHRGLLTGHTVTRSA
jgi:hypothetical protein